MKAFVLTTLLLIGRTCLAWEVIHQTDDLKVWKSSKFKNVYLSEKIVEMPSKLYGKLDDFDLLEANMKKRGFLSLLGVGHWTITDKQVDAKKNMLKLEGNYLDGRKQLNHFLESHQYEKLKSTQILITTVAGKVKLEDVLLDFKNREGQR